MIILILQCNNELLKGNNFEDLKDMREENIKYTDISGLKYIAQRHFCFASAQDQTY